MPDQATGRRVVILGAGLAGLCAAYNLMCSGFDVRVLEAQERPGGRVQTVRDGFVNGGYAEVGAARILDVHGRVHNYISKFGLAGSLFEYDDSGETLWYVEGQRFITPKDGTYWPLERMSMEERRDPFGLLRAYLGPALRLVYGRTDSAQWPNVGSDVLELDKLTLRQFFHSNGASDAWLGLLRAANPAIGDLNALAFAAQANQQAGSSVSYGLRGGNDQLPEAFAAALGNRVTFRSIVRRIVSRPDEVVVGYQSADGAQREIVADYGVCAIPFPVLRDLELDGLAAEKSRAIERYQLCGAARVCFQTKTAFWREDALGALGGFMMIGTDTAAGQILNTSLGQGGSEGMLQAYLLHDNAVELERIPHEERAHRIRAEIARFLPGLDQEIIASYTKMWQEDPYARGAIALAEPDQLKWIFPAARRPDNRLHFAGEHTAVSIGWMDGALESGERVADEIVGRCP